MRNKATYLRSAGFAATPLALAATLIIFSEPNARAATLTNAGDPTAISILLNNAAAPTTTFTGAISSGPFQGHVANFSTTSPNVGVTGGNTVSALNNFTFTAPPGGTFTDLTFSTDFTGMGNNSNVTATGSDGSSVTEPFARND